MKPISVGIQQVNLNQDEETLLLKMKLESKTVNVKDYSEMGLGFPISFIHLLMRTLKMKLLVDLNGLKS